MAGAEVCYEKLGCFSDEMPWSGTTERPITRLPWSPEKINARFLLFTRQNPESYQVSLNFCASNHCALLILCRVGVKWY